MKTHNNFSKIKDSLKNAYILEYCEYDENGRKYFSSNHLLTFFHNYNDDSAINLLNAKNGDFIHSISKQKDFSHFSIFENFVGDTIVKELTLFFNSGYIYKCFFTNY